MKLANSTALSADIFRTTVSEERVLAAVVVRRTFKLARPNAPDRGTLQPWEPGEPTPWPVSHVPYETPWGEMEADGPFPRGGVDLMLFGSAWAPRGTRVQMLRVRAQVGRQLRELAVFGDRYWRKQRDDLVASEPGTFDHMPLSIGHAFGGRTVWDGLSVPYPLNPEGRGYYIDQDAAVDGPLPNLELVEAPVRHWRDQPEPAGVGFCPQTHGLRILSGTKLSEDKSAIEMLTPRLHNAAFPRMVLEGVAPGLPVHVEGLHPDGALSFQLQGPGAWVQLRLGDALHERPLAIDQIGIDAERGLLFISYRFPFTYRVIAKEVRECHLLPMPDAAPS